VAQAEIGIIGGSGLYTMPGLTKVKEVRVKTPLRRAFRRLYLRCARRAQSSISGTGTGADIGFCRAN